MRLEIHSKPVDCVFGPSICAMLGSPPLTRENPTGSELRQRLGYATIGRLLLNQILTLCSTPSCISPSIVCRRAYSDLVSSDRLIVDLGHQAHPIRPVRLPKLVTIRTQPSRQVRRHARKPSCGASSPRRGDRPRYLGRYLLMKIKFARWPLRL